MSQDVVVELCTDILGHLTPLYVNLTVVTNADHRVGPCQSKVDVCRLCEVHGRRADVLGVKRK